MKKILTSLVSATMLLSMSTTLTHAQNISLGANVNADTTSPSGYTVTFNYDTSDDTKWTDQSKIKVTGSFDYYREGTTSPVYTPEQYENGMNPANTGNYSKEMADEDGDRIYSTSFPITSGAFQYSYVLDYDGDFNTKDDQITIADPHNLARFNSAQSTYETSCLNTSVVYGKYDAVKQSQSHDYSFVLPATQNQGSVDYVNYTGSLTNKDLTDVEVFDKTTKTHQNLGIYLPSGYDAQRQEPYKVIYLSHGGGGNEVDWFSYGHVDAGARHAEEQAVGVFELFPVCHDDVMGKCVEPVIDGFAIHAELLRHKGNENGRGAGRHAALDLNAVMAQRKAGKKTVLLLEVQPLQGAVVFLDDTGHREQVIVQLPAGRGHVYHKEGQQEHSFIPAL